jgi:hypothetical protein
MVSARPRILFVTGMHRSGTSAIARELFRLGGVVPDDLLPASKDNPAGFFESDFVVRTNERILELFGSNWRDPSRLPSDWLDAAKTSPYYRQVSEFLAGLDTVDNILILKDPRFSRTLPFWLSACAEQGLVSRVLVVIRDPVSVARSLWVRNHIPSGHSLQLWCRYYIDLHQSVAHLAYGVIAFDGYIKAPELLVQALGNLELSTLDVSAPGNSMDESLIHHQAPMPESRCERELQKDFQQKQEGSLINESLLRFHYSILGGDLAAVERRHYATIAMILDTVVAEKNTLSCTNGYTTTRVNYAAELKLGKL